MDEGNNPSRASEWLVALTERPEDADLRADFEAWLRADPAHARDWQEIARTWEVLGETLKVDHEAAGVANHATRPPDSVTTGGARPDAWCQWRAWPWRFGRRRIGACAAAALLAVGLWSLPPPEPSNGHTLFTGTGEVRRVSLADGSVVQLAPRSGVEVLFGQEERRLRLTTGIAWFEVAHDRTRPFVVRAGETTVTALGTAFEIRLVGAALQVSVREGLVEMDDHGAAAQIGDGEWIRVAADGARASGRVRPELVAAWLDRQVVAGDRPLGEVVEEVRRYHEGAIVLLDGALAARPVTGIYDLSDPAAALTAIAEAHAARVYHLSPWLLVMTGN